MLAARWWILYGRKLHYLEIICFWLRGGPPDFLQMDIYKTVLQNKTPSANITKNDEPFGITVSSQGFSRECRFYLINAGVSLADYQDTFRTSTKDTNRLGHIGEGSQSHRIWSGHLYLRRIIQAMHICWTALLWKVYLPSTVFLKVSVQNNLYLLHLAMFPGTLHQTMTHCMVAVLRSIGTPNCNRPAKAPLLGYMSSWPPPRHLWEIRHHLIPTSCLWLLLRRRWSPSINRPYRASRTASRQQLASAPTP